MSSFADELLHRITDARQALQRAQEAGEIYAARVYTGELDSLFRLAKENGIPIPAEPESTTEPPDAGQN